MSHGLPRVGHIAFVLLPTVIWLAIGVQLAETRTHGSNRLCGKVLAIVNEEAAAGSPEGPNGTDDAMLAALIVRVWKRVQAAAGLDHEVTETLRSEVSAVEREVAAARAGRNAATSDGLRSAVDAFVQGFEDECGNVVPALPEPS